MNAAESEQAQKDDCRAVREDCERASEGILRNEWSEWQTYTNIRSSVSARRVCRTLRLPESMHLNDVKGVCNEIMHTIINPGVMAPSQIPRTNRAANKPPKLLQAA